MSPRLVSRRSVLRAGAAALSAARFAMAQNVKSIQTPVLDIAYKEIGQGFPVILLHGFPDDALAFDDVAPPLVKAGYRVLVPYLRGYGPTRFRDAAAPRTAEQAAALARGADGVVVGSALVDAVRKSLSPDGTATSATVPAVSDLVSALAQGVRGARRT